MAAAATTTFDDVLHCIFDDASDIETPVVDVDDEHDDDAFFNNISVVFLFINS